MDDPKICPYCDLSAEEYCIQCDKCMKWIHYACSNLPVYTVIQLHKSSRLFSCSSCVHERFIGTYTDLYDKFNKIIQAQNTTMKRPTGIITDDIHVDITNTSVASSTDENQDPALILTPHSHHSHTATPPQSPSQPPAQLAPTIDQSTVPTGTNPILQTEPTPTGKPNLVPSSSANTVGSQTEIDAIPDGSIDGDRDVTCRFYLQGRCKHGKMGKDCAFKHPPMCFKFIRRGPSACSKGATCNYIHPKLCNNALQTGKCYRITCKFYHIAGTLREDPSTISKRPNLMDIPVFPPQPSSSNANVPPRQLPHHLPRPNQLATHQQNHPTYPLPSQHPPQLRHPVPSQPQPVHTGYSHAGNSQSQNPSRYAPLQASQSQQRNVNPKPTIQNPSSTPNQLIQQGNHSPANDSAFTPIHPPTNSPVFLEELRVVKQLMSQMQQMQSQLIQSMNYHYPLLPGPNPAL